MNMIRTMWRAAFLAAAVALAACGGGSDTCVDVTGGNACAGNDGGGSTAPVASDLVLVLSATTVPNDGSQTVVATATALDANRNTLAEVPVTIAVDAGATATTSGAVTDDDGSVNAAIGIGSDRSNRTVTVTARSGSLTRTAQLNVVAAVGGGGIAVEDLVLTLSSSTVANTGNETIVATAIALSGSRNVIAGVPVSISVNNDAVVAPSGSVTDASGQLTAAVGIGSNQSNRDITVTATGGGITRTATLQVTDAGAVGVPSDMVLALSSASIPNNGAQTVTATVTALDARRNTLAGVPVSISVDANAVATPAGTVTGSNGTLNAAIGIGGDNSNRTITVTATAAGGVTRTAVLQVSDAPVTGVPVAADLSLVLSAPTLDNGGTNTITAVVTAVDANRNALAGIPVTVRVDESAVATVSGTATNTQGLVTAQVGIGADRSNRNITVTAVSGTLTRTATFAVVGARLTASFAPRVSAGASDRIEYTLLDTNALPMVGESVTVSASDGTVSSGTTDSNGKYSFDYTAPSGASQFVVQADAAGVNREVTIEVSPGTIAPVDPALTIKSASITPTPSVVTVNSTATSNNVVEIRGLFVGSTATQDNVPVPRVRARFRVLNNADGSLGSISWVGGTYAISDDSGVARATFKPGAIASPTNGVTVAMCWDDADFTVPTNATDANWCSASSAQATLTIVDEALSVNIRTNELIKSGAAELTYIKEFVVMVVDAAGQAKADVQITPSVDLTGYYKGFYFWNGDQWQQSMTLVQSENYTWATNQWRPTVERRADAPPTPVDGQLWFNSSTGAVANCDPQRVCRWDATSNAWNEVTAQVFCPNEDVNRNGVRDASAFNPAVAAPVLSARGEDLSWNGDIDPRKADVAIKMVGASKTDANGLAIVQIEYGRNLATWVDFVITVTASGVSGTEARARFVGNRYGVGNLPAPGVAFTNQDVFPAFGVSPYGVGDNGVCTDGQ